MAQTTIGGAGTTTIGGAGTTTLAVGASYLVNQNFEGTGYDNGETWVTNGTVDPDYTGTVLRGSQSLLLNDVPPTTNFAKTTIAAQTDVWAFYDIRFVSLPSGESSNGIRLNGTSDLYVNVDSSGNVKLVTGGGASSASSTTLSTATLYHAWLHFVSGGTCLLAISTGTTRPTVDGSGNVYLTKTSAAGNVSDIYCFKGDDSSAVTIFDHVLVSTSEIGDNP